MAPIFLAMRKFKIIYKNNINGNNGNDNVVAIDDVMEPIVTVVYKSNRRITRQNELIDPESLNESPLSKMQPHKRDLFKKKLAARMLLMGFEPNVVASVLRATQSEIRSWLNDRDFKICMKGLEDELFGAMEKHFQFLMKEAMDKLSDLLRSEDEQITLEAVDRILRAHGKYVDKFKGEIEDITPPERRVSPEAAERLLEKGIEYLKLSREQNLLEHNIVDITEKG